MLSICGADMQKETPTGYTPIHIAALSGHVNCLKVMVSAQDIHYLVAWPCIFLVASCIRV